MGLAAAGCGGGVVVASPLDDPPGADGVGAAVTTTAMVRPSEAGTER